MLITYFGIILFEISEWVKFIKSKPPNIREKCGDAPLVFRQRHPAPIWPARIKRDGLLSVFHRSCGVILAGGTINIGAEPVFGNIPIAGYVGQW